MTKQINRVYEKEKKLGELYYGHSCVLMADYTLSFEYDEGWRGGGSYLNKNFYKNYGNSYVSAVQKELDKIRNTNPEYYAKIKQMVKPCLWKYPIMYFSMIKPKQRRKIKIIDDIKKYMDKNEKLQKKIVFAIKVITRLKYEIHDLKFKQAIDEAIKELEK